MGPRGHACCLLVGRPFGGPLPWAWHPGVLPACLAGGPRAPRALEGSCPGRTHRLSYWFFTHVLGLQSDVFCLVDRLSVFHQQRGLRGRQKLLRERNPRSLVWKTVPVFAQLGTVGCPVLVEWGHLVGCYRKRKHSFPPRASVGFKGKSSWEPDAKEACWVLVLDGISVCRAQINNPTGSGNADSVILAAP